MVSVKTISGMRRVRIKKNDGEGEFKYDVFDRTFVNDTMYPHPEQQFKKWIKYGTQRFMNDTVL
jgi:hypothetical protein